MSSFVPSAYQKAIYRFILDDDNNGIIEAVAGSGKTTTIVAGMGFIPVNQRAIFLAFNKNIAETLKGKMPVNGVASTFHSAGFRAWRQKHPKAELDDRKNRNILKKLITYEDNKRIGAGVLQLVDLAQQVGIPVLKPDNDDTWRELIDHFDVAVSSFDEEETIATVRTVLKRSIEEAESVVSFNDMLYMPIYEGLSLSTYDYIFIDEAQDTNNVRREMARKMVRSGSRLVAVGDTNQAIYGFTGADSDSMEKIKTAFQCQEFPLSICYRCGKAIVKEAQQYVSKIEASETASDGIVANTTFGETPPNSTDAILCRNTAPLIDLAYQFIGEGRGCRILGRDIGKGLKILIEQMRTDDIAILRERLADFKNTEMERLNREGREQKAQNVADRVECLETIIENLDYGEQTMEGLSCEIDRLFEDKTGVVTLSTVHKAKGLEWERVYIYRPELMPSRYAKQPWQAQQETNLMYVATTRAMKELYYVREVRGL